MSGDDETVTALGDAVDEACAPVLYELTAPHLPAIREALRDVDANLRPSSEEIVERMRSNGLDDLDPSGS